MHHTHVYILCIPTVELSFMAFMNLVHWYVFRYVADFSSLKLL